MSKIVNKLDYLDYIYLPDGKLHYILDLITHTIRTNQSLYFIIKIIIEYNPPDNGYWISHLNYFLSKKEQKVFYIAGEKQNKIYVQILASMNLCRDHEAEDLKLDPHVSENHTILHIEKIDYQGISSLFIAFVFHNDVPSTMKKNHTFFIIYMIHSNEIIMLPKLSSRITHDHKFLVMESRIYIINNRSNQISRLNLGLEFKGKKRWDILEPVIILNRFLSRLALI